MKIHRSFRPLSKPYSGLAVGIGNFDGVHLGHRKIIRECRIAAGEEGTVGVITFPSHTRSLVEGREEKLLLTIRDRLGLLEKAGVDAVWLVEFTRRLAGMPPEDFAAKVLGDALRVRTVTVGRGYRFGRAGRGTVAVLAATGRRHGFRVREVPAVRRGGVRVSSSAIRRAVVAGEMDKAAALLGYPYFLSGTVRAGRGRGAGLGYPTANFRPEQLRPAPGVYAAWIVLDRRPRPGLLYLGEAPTFPPTRRPYPAEAHIFGWEGNLYGARIKVWLKKKLREDIKFDNIACLLERIRADENAARGLLKKAPSGNLPADSRRRK